MTNLAGFACDQASEAALRGERSEPLSAASGDLGDGMVREWQTRPGRPGARGHGRCALHRLRLPEAQMHENRSHHDRVLDQCDDAHRAFALHALERIGFIHLADQSRPGRFGAARDLAQDFGEAAGDRRRSRDLRRPRPAQPYPSKPVKIIVPFPTGGIADIYACIIGNRLTETWGQPVVLENRTGAGGNIGADLVAKTDTRSAWAASARTPSTSHCSASCPTTRSGISRRSR